MGGGRKVDGGKKEDKGSEKRELDQASLRKELEAHKLNDIPQIH